MVGQNFSVSYSYDTFSSSVQPLQDFLYHLFRTRLAVRVHHIWCQWSAFVQIFINGLIYTVRSLFEVRKLASVPCFRSLQSGSKLPSKSFPTIAEDQGLDFLLKLPRRQIGWSHKAEGRRSRRKMKAARRA